LEMKRVIKLQTFCTQSSTSDFVLAESTEVK
jgi:hypothetical protein